MKEVDINKRNANESGVSTGFEPVPFHNLLNEPIHKLPWAISMM